jgi:NifU-like protein involved in Fe-S cluster formation
MKQPNVEFTGEMLELHREAFRIQGRKNNRWCGKSQLDIAIALDLPEQEVQDILFKLEE